MNYSGIHTVCYDRMNVFKTIENFKSNDMEMEV